MTKFLESGDWVDTWRKRNPGVRRYTYWPTKIVTARPNSLGWRLDYFVVTKDIDDEIGLCEIRDKTKGSDHCPIVLSVPRRRFFKENSGSELLPPEIIDLRSNITLKKLWGNSPPKSKSEESLNLSKDPDNED